MDTQALESKDVIEAVEDAVLTLLAIASSLDNRELNRIPYNNSWSAGQLLRHVSKSMNAMAMAMDMKGKEAERNPAERIPEMKKIFQDYSHKMKSPAMVVPESGPYEKELIMAKLSRSLHRVQESGRKAVLNEMADNLPVGPVTKLEVLYFILYHTERHVYQMKKICDALKKHMTDENV